MTKALIMQKGWKIGQNSIFQGALHSFHFGVKERTMAEDGAGGF